MLSLTDRGEQISEVLIKDSQVRLGEVRYFRSCQTDQVIMKRDGSMNHCERKRSIAVLDDVSVQLQESCKILECHIP